MTPPRRRRRRFIEAGPDEFIYARYGNPTVSMFEKRIAMIEGAEDAFATASGMAAVSGALTSHAEGGRSCRRGARPVRLVPLCARATC